MRISTSSPVSRHPPMSAELKPDVSEFADFADALRKQRLGSEQVVRRALNRANAHYPVPLTDDLNDVSRALDNARNVIERAVEELHLQNDALFAARTEVEDAYAQFRDFFEFAPAPYVVTSPDTRVRVRYANHAACSSPRPSKKWARRPVPDQLRSARASRRLQIGTPSKPCCPLLELHAGER